MAKNKQYTPQLNNEEKTMITHLSNQIIDSENMIEKFKAQRKELGDS
ncbi:hypothetical protein [Enterococcus pernyi]|nr:hypothetical protein [Enterococcus pernyi]